MVNGTPVLLSYFGNLVCWDESERSVKQIHPRDVTGATFLLRLPTQEHQPLQFVSLSGKVVQVGVPDFQPERGFHTLAINVILTLQSPHGTAALVAIRAGHQYLRASFDGTIDMTATEINDWEQFRPLDPLALNDLIGFFRYDWLMKGSRQHVFASQTQMVNQRFVNIGGHDVAFSDLPLFEAERTEAPPDELAPAISGILFRDGWKHDRLLLFNPLVAFVMFGQSPSLLRQFQLSVHSLHVLGKYDGAILVLTDQPADLLASCLPPALRYKLLIHPMVANDRMDIVAARLVLGNLPAIAHYQPVLYADADIVFDAPLAPVLKILTLSGLFSAQYENFNPLGEAPSVGGTLFQDDPMPLREKFGFNAGLLGMPGAWRAGAALRTAALALARYTGANGRDGLPWYEQSMLNYSLRRLDLFYPEPITSRTQICEHGDQLDVHAPRGFIHFWPAHDRALEMERYLAKLAPDMFDEAGSK